MSLEMSGWGEIAIAGSSCCYLKFEKEIEGSGS